MSLVLWFQRSWLCLGQSVAPPTASRLHYRDSGSHDETHRGSACSACWRRRRRSDEAPKSCRQTTTPGSTKTHLKESFWRLKGEAECHKIKSFYLLLYGLESVVGRGQAVAVWRKSGSGVGFDQWERSLVLLPRNLQQELNAQHNIKN